MAWDRTKVAMVEKKKGWERKRSFAIEHKIKLKLFEIAMVTKEEEEEEEEEKEEEEEEERKRGFIKCVR